MRVTNNTGISLATAVWLLQDNYDYVKGENYISVTSLMKPLRQILLPSRMTQDMQTVPDVVDYVPTALGHALHDSIEKAWLSGYKKPLSMLGYPEEVINNIRINPKPEELTPDTISIYLEQRAIRKHKGFDIGGKFDMVADGIVHDNKSTSAYTWVYGGRDKEHQLQGSLYRWLNPDKITEDFIRINYIFTDWQKAAALSNPNYPQKRVEAKDIPLLSIAETEKWIDWKLNQIQTYENKPESQIPNCTDEELWLSDPVHKYYADPTKTTGRSTKNFDSLSEANKFKAEKGKGIVITVIGEPKRCGYCQAFPICTQKDRYFNA